MCLLQFCVPMLMLSCWRSFFEQQDNLEVPFLLQLPTAIHPDQDNDPVVGKHILCVYGMGFDCLEGEKELLDLDGWDSALLLVQDYHTTSIADLLDWGSTFLSKMFSD